ncbi:hypothetical protein C343_03159 [Cryptococcus neoformans C23]|uniref:Uncharacterized protein n=2 Tax=Cryptococcus neoformans TaxID=5207 RepID=A0A854QHT2_CRYNE|nr:hypothetical protein CNAG_01077 [Cryptococcus neoformans var. grubii H99]AUB24811.1 hypothetical protein CKF44_01077 [Cryptococcus neoformans var. grubii]OWZ32523.1 hypothetical protein C347_03222 [Cryptococcus neoformans var. grubii AD2-60a]OWZ44045.1 hypothetical protein C353_03062 [Cryptococcus neoformans var. grubii AD1-83a]OWZ44370.1 hypothetical protein C343_03159 [Cryptococcus neoformans var. grubii C23]OWZ57613.1 hypothetical protein C368_00779 [Cryptococcus neoformans var. grubii 1|eukprot:XP_012049300.1 hypothetical protein CNAG_01077 [Cryptococcus neoformans var. grubii H99]
MSKANKVSIVDPSGPAPSKFASNMIVSGKTVYLAGAVGTDKSGQFIPGTIKDRTRQALRNAEERLQFLGLDLSDVVSVTIFLSKYEEDFASMNEAYIASFPTDVPLPVRTCVGVAALPAGTDIEMTLIAAKRD